ncbi:MAG: hypothetical protein KGL53_16065 [Elusimicrobia bacterium]|nr:hypothetical protein [Elusimicrobiota bacterium]
MRLLLPFLLVLAAVPVSAGRAKALQAAWEASCAPWDGPALHVSVPKLGLNVMLYGEDIVRFKAGKAVRIKAKPENSGSTATEATPGGLRAFKSVPAELKRVPSSSKGYVLLGGVRYPLVFKELAGPPPFCG